VLGMLMMKVAPVTANEDDGDVGDDDIDDDDDDGDDDDDDDDDKHFWPVVTREVWAIIVIII
jgi:hypothetical protein